MFKKEGSDFFQERPTKTRKHMLDQLQALKIKWNQPYGKAQWSTLRVEILKERNQKQFFLNHFFPLPVDDDRVWRSLISVATTFLFATSTVDWGGGKRVREMR